MRPRRLPKLRRLRLTSKRACQRNPQQRLLSLPLLRSLPRLLRRPNLRSQPRLLKRLLPRLLLLLTLLRLLKRLLLRKLPPRRRCPLGSCLLLARRF